MGYIMAGLDLWVKVEDGKIVRGATPLPPDVAAWGADKNALINSGWFPVVSVKPDSMDTRTEVWESESYEIKDDHVVWTLVKRSKTQEELDAELAERWRLWRIERNFRLAKLIGSLLNMLSQGNRYLMNGFLIGKRCVTCP